MKEYEIKGCPYYCMNLIRHYPDLTEEASMSPKQLLDLGYDFEELIPRRESVEFKCRVVYRNGRHIVYEYCDGEYFKLGYVPGLLLGLEGEHKVRVEGGQKIKVVEGEHRNKVEEVVLPYKYILIAWDYDRLMPE